MTEIQKKIELLKRIAQRLNEAHVQWALGASMLLYFKGITSALHDVDLMVADHAESHVPDEDLYGIPHRIDRGIDRGRCHGRLCHRA